MRHILIATSFTVVSLTTGCLMDGGAEIEPIEQAPDAVKVESYRPVLGAMNGRLSGVIGPMTGIDNEATELSTYDDGYYVSLETVVALPERAAMTLLSVSNGSALFQPGVHATFRLQDNEDGMRVTMLGCVGQSPGVYDEYDAPADEVDVDISAPASGDEGELDVALSGRWFERSATGERLDTFVSANTRLTLLR